MSSDPVKDILFIRKYPKKLVERYDFRKHLSSILCKKGASVRYNGHEITFCFLGYGKWQKALHPEIIQKLQSGKITDIIDIGGGGALDPALKRGDILLSRSDIPIDSWIPMKVRRRKEIRDVVQTIAGKHQRRFLEKNILTTDKIIGSRNKRIALFHKTGCSAVQMEHCWFLQKLQAVVEKQTFSSVYVSHIEIISDTVQQRDTPVNRLSEFIQGLLFCVLRNQIHVGAIKNDFLKTWLKDASK